MKEGLQAQFDPQQLLGGVEETHAASEIERSLHVSVPERTGEGRMAAVTAGYTFQQKQALPPIA